MTCVHNCNESIIVKIVSFNVTNLGSASGREDNDVDNNLMSGDGDSTSSALVDFRSDPRIARLVDWDESSHNQGRIRQSRQINPFYTSDGGMGILLSLLVVAFVLLVITFVVLRR